MLIMTNMKAVKSVFEEILRVVNVSFDGRK